MRVSSVIAPSLIGTLKSTRMKTRLPRSSRSLTEYFVTLEFLQQINAAVRIPPLVVVPRHHLDEVAVHYLRVGGVDDRRVRVAAKIDRHERVGHELHDALHRSFRR